MKLRDLKLKSKVELEKMLTELCEKRFDFEVKAAGKQLKDVRELRDLKLTVARIKTLLKNLK